MAKAKSTKKQNSRVFIPPILRPLLVPLKSLTEYPNNSQTHTEADVTEFAKVLLEFGYTQPATVWPDGKGTTWYAAGHLRNRAMLLLGEAHIPAVPRPEWTERQFRAYVIADNQWTKRAAWDFPRLKNELVDLDTGEFNLKLTGFDAADMGIMVGYNPEEKTPLENPEIEGETYGTGRFILVYIDEAEKSMLAERLGIDGRRVVYRASEVCGD